MALNLATLLGEVETALDTISGLRVSDTIPERIAPPIAVCTLGQVAYDQSFDGSMDVEVEVTVIVGRQSIRSGQTDLYGYMAPTGSGSIKAAIEGGTYTQDVAVRVTGVPGLIDIDVAGGSYIGATFSVAVLQ